MAEFMLTTVDNPYDPFTRFDEWYQWDTSNGYFTTAYLARVATTSDELSEVDQKLSIVYAIDEIVKENILGVYRKVSSEDPPIGISGASS